MITIPTMERVAAGGICNSAAAVDLARAAMVAMKTCERAYYMCEALKPGGTHADKVFSSVHVHNILANLVLELDHTLAMSIDIGDGRSLREAVDELTPEQRENIEREMRGETGE